MLRYYAEADHYISARIAARADHYLPRESRRAMRRRKLPYRFVDISVTATSVIKSTGATFYSPLGYAGETITAGMPVYKKAADGLIYKADANLSDATATCIGIALNGGGVGQPIVIQSGGNLTFNAVLTALTEYVVSSAAGGIAPKADVTTGWYYSSLGYAISTTVLKITIVNSGLVSA